ncbi:MAG: GGDEF domain-containing protein [Alphaproteobacteria bacterium]|nr:GGDEF domain-containing protein [Alphaproteobacteria bacterium]
MLAELGIPPLPEHYTLFYHYAEGKNPQLNEDIDKAMNGRMPFSQHLLKNFYNRYIVAAANDSALHEVTQGTNRLLGEVLRVVGEFGKETSGYNADIDSYLQKMSVDIADHSVQGLIKEIISTTVAMRERGESLHHKLTASKDEIETLKKNLDQLTHESQRDFLTGVYNRKALDKMLAEQFAQQADISVLMLDVDHFKKFNDKFGHLLGDEVLKIVARAITYCVRGKDIVARYGGEEFCVLLPSTPLQGATKVAENIRTTIATRDLKRKDTGESFGSITVSIGIAQVRHSDTAETLLKRADEALYKSKHTGRNRVTAEGE